MPRARRRAPVQLASIRQADSSACADQEIIPTVPTGRNLCTLHHGGNSSIAFIARCCIRSIVYSTCDIKERASGNQAKRIFGTRRVVGLGAGPDHDHSGARAAVLGRQIVRRNELVFQVIGTVMSALGVLLAIAGVAALGRGLTPFPGQCRRRNCSKGAYMDWFAIRSTAGSSWRASAGPWCG